MKVIITLSSQFSAESHDIHSSSLGFQPLSSRMTGQKEYFQRNSGIYLESYGFYEINLETLQNSNQRIGDSCLPSVNVDGSKSMSLTLLECYFEIL